MSLLSDSGMSTRFVSLLDWGTSEQASWKRQHRLTVRNSVTRSIAEVTPAQA